MGAFWVGLISASSTYADNEWGLIWISSNPPSDPANEIHRVLNEEAQADSREAVFKFKSDNYYERLGLSSAASEDDIRRGFRKAARLCHPDLYGGLSKAERARKEEEFKAINEAYEVLSDAGKRKTYDELGKEGLKHRHSSPSHSVSIEDLFDLVVSFGNPLYIAGFVRQIAPLIKTNPAIKLRIVHMAQSSTRERAHLFGFTVRQAAVQAVIENISEANELLEILRPIIYDRASSVANVRVFAILALRDRVHDPAISDFLFQLYLSYRSNFIYWMGENSKPFFWEDPGSRELAAASLEALGGAASSCVISEEIFLAASNHANFYPKFIQAAAARAIPAMVRANPSLLPRVMELIQFARSRTPLSDFLPPLYRALAAFRSHVEVVRLLDDAWRSASYLSNPLGILLALLEADPDLTIRIPNAIDVLKYQLMFLWNMPNSDLVRMVHGLGAEADLYSRWSILSLLYSALRTQSKPAAQWAFDELLNKLASDSQHRATYQNFAQREFNAWNGAFLNKILCVDALGGLGPR